MLAAIAGISTAMRPMADPSIALLFIQLCGGRGGSSRPGSGLRRALAAMRRALAASPRDIRFASVTSL
jgi:hypothetical protein